MNDTKLPQDSVHEASAAWLRQEWKQVRLDVDTIPVLLTDAFKAGARWAWETPQIVQSEDAPEVLYRATGDYLPDEAVAYACEYGFKDGKRAAMDNVIVARAYDAGKRSVQANRVDKAIGDFRNESPENERMFQEARAETRAEMDDPFVRSILETLADREWDPNDICADGGVTGLDVVRKDARTALGK